MRLHEIARVVHVDPPMIGRVARTAVADRRDETWLLAENGAPACDPPGYLGVLGLGDVQPAQGIPVAYGLRQLGYLDNGDVVAVEPNGFVRTLYRRKSRHNVALIERCRDRLPSTALHVLTNGRLSFYRRFAAKLGRIAHPDLMLGIPLYSDVDARHDYIVQASGAFEETHLGLLNLDRYGVAVEIRLVLHALSVPRLPQLATFITRNLPLVRHVALMGLELFGLVHQHLDELWIDPADYQSPLRDAAETLCDAGMKVSIYDHQLCVLDPELWPLAVKSISDWKNVYLPECKDCGVMDRCGGFFQSGTKLRSAYIRPLPATGGGA